MNDATYAKHAVVANLDPLLPATRWAAVDRAFRAGSGVLVRFEARLVPGIARHLERLAALGDPQLATPVEYGVDGDEAWLLYAGTLDDALDALSGPLSMGELAQLGEALVAGLERAHDQGFIHPGLSSSLVRMHIGFDGRVHPELLGLGLPATSQRGVQDDLADVAALLYTLYTGRPPFELGAPRDGSHSPRPFSDVRPGGAAPASFEAAIMRALGPRAQAYWTAAEFRVALAMSPQRRTGSSQRPSMTTDPNLPRVARDASFAAPLPVAAPVPEALPAQATERTLATSQHPVESRSAWRWWLLAALLLLGAGLALGLTLGGTGDAPRSAETQPTEHVDERRAVSESPIEPVVADRAEVVVPPAPAPVEPAVVEPAVVEPAVVEPAVVEPAVVEPAVVEPAVVEPAVVEPALVEPAVVEPAAPAPPAAVQPADALTPPASSHLALSSEPAGALVKVNGVERGRTPLALDLRPSDLPATIVFERRGYLPAERKLAALDGEAMALAVALRQRPRATPPVTTTSPPPGGSILLGR